MGRHNKPKNERQNYHKDPTEAGKSGSEPIPPKKPKEDPKIPIYCHKPSAIHWDLKNTKKIKIICFDLETTFGNDISEIYQIGAIASPDDKVLINILPRGAIDWRVVKFAGTNVTTEFDKTTRRKYLWHTKNKQEIPSVSPEEGWTTFVDWMKGLKNKYNYDRMILAAHGNLDAPTLLNNLAEYGLLQEFMPLFDAFWDTSKTVQNKIIAAFERLHPGETFEAHNALADAEALFKILQKSKKLEASDEILEHCVSSEDSLNLAKFKVSKQLQGLGKPPKGIFVIDALLMVPDLSKVVFKNNPPPEDFRHKGLDKSKSIFVALDIQMIQSNGIRAEIGEISAQVISDSRQSFHIRCHGFQEEHLQEIFKPVEEGLKLFMKFVEKMEKQVVFLFAKPDTKQWPALVNHLYFHGLESNLFKNVKGICDLQKIIEKNKIKNAKMNIELHRSSDVIAHIVTTLQTNFEDIHEASKDVIFDVIKTMPNTKKKLDSALAEDISNGKYFPAGHIGNFRIPCRFLPESCN